MLCAVGGLGCAQTMAACRPGPIDRSVLAQGVHREAVIEAFGPGRGRLKPGAVVWREHFRYDDGGKKNVTASKAGRIVLYTAADVFTIGMAQAITGPTEVMLAGKHYRTTVNFQLFTDGSWRVKDFVEKDRGYPHHTGICRVANR